MSLRSCLTLLLQGRDAATMGFVSGSVFAVAGDDPHGHFLYYVPSERVRYEWINRWFTDNFGLLASRLGPRAMIVAPAEGKAEAFRASLARAGVELKLEKGYDTVNQRQPFFEETGQPFVLVSRRPIGNGTDRQAGPWDEAGVIKFVAINLAAYTDKGQLTLLMDALVEGVGRGVDLLPVIPEIEASVLAKEDVAKASWGEVVELKPNVYGIGINVNELIERVRRRLGL